MKVCQNCTAFEDPECTIYQRIPPHTFAERCRHFQIVAEYVPPPAEIKKADEKPNCVECGYHSPGRDMGWCLCLDHPDWIYNFVKIKEDFVCPRKDL